MAGLSVLSVAYRGMFVFLLETFRDDATDDLIHGHPEKPSSSRIPTYPADLKYTLVACCNDCQTVAILFPLDRDADQLLFSIF